MRPDADEYVKRQEAATIALFEKYHILLPNMYWDRYSPNWCMAQFPLGWTNLLDKLLADLRPIPGWNRQIHQIKSKFGGLRFYVGCNDPKVLDLIARAENESYRICEECGQPGLLVTITHWVWTLCYQHANALAYQDLSGEKLDQKLAAFAYHFSWRGGLDRLLYRIKQVPRNAYYWAKYYNWVARFYWDRKLLNPDNKT